MNTAEIMARHSKGGTAAWPACRTCISRNDEGDVNSLPWPCETWELAATVHNAARPREYLGVQTEGTWTEEMVSIPARYLTEQDQTVRDLLSLLASIEASNDIPAMHRNAHRAAQNCRALLSQVEDRDYQP